ncbi:MAG: hypothetical protein NVS4B7_09400 [Ktedonobacteraceae bacterium]
MRSLKKYFNLLITIYIMLCLFTACSSEPFQQPASLPAASKPVMAGGEPVLPHSQVHFQNAPLPTQADLRYANQAWTLPGHDNASTRLVTLPTCCTTRIPTPLWFHSLGTPVLNAPIIGNNRIYLLASDGYLHVLAVQTGEEQWRLPIGGELAANGLALAHKMLYVARSGHFMTAIDANTGQERWRFDTVGIVRAAPVVIGPVVLVTSGANSLFCLNALTGKEFWAFHSEDTLAEFWPTRTTPVVANGLVYVALGASNEFDALDLRTGRKVWEVALHERMTGGPMLNQTLALVYVVTWSGHVVALDAHTGKLRWHLSLAGGSESSPALSQRLGILYVGSFGNALYALDAGTGRLYWRLSTVSAINAAPLVIQTATQDWVVAASQDGNFLIVDAHTGKLLYKWQLGELRAAPVVAAGILFQASLTDQGLFAFKL